MNLGWQSETMEYSQSLAQLRKGMIDITAILNKHGAGVIYFGVDPDGEVVGCRLGSNSKNLILSRIAEDIYPPIDPEISFEKADGREYINVAFEGAYRPYSCRNRYFIRVGPCNFMMPTSLLKELFLRLPDRIAIPQMQGRLMPSNGAYIAIGAV